ncbi:lambda family phage portal protein [Angulomicrobium tetraedrale]|uniref:Lambda family phage portal protein n=1 Tax=Ancylobacter tetraedralis TaxID=217068 RepID=A0A839Z9X8_9HYPH|nr:phage portal protein [Ancylobacter tetraedralis]MBB3771536.1 lambda family phage portal protein [Ancylobacter tetraedralis]
MRPSARYLRDNSTGILSMRRAYTRDSARDVWEAADRAYALATDFVQNNGWIAGAVEQVVTDMVGPALTFNFRPNLTGLGYDDKQASAWASLVEDRFTQWSGDKNECDLAGESTLIEMLDGATRYYLAGGEAFVVLDFLPPLQRQGAESGTRFSLVAPHRVPRTTNQMEGLYQGIFRDANGRATHYRFRRCQDGIDRDEDIAARTANGLPNVIHAMDRGAAPGSPRGITPLAPCLKAIAQSDQLADATLATALLQTAFAATIKSPEPSQAAFEAIQTLADTDPPSGWTGTAAEWTTHVGGIQADLIDVWGQRIDALKKGGINLAESARIGHLGPGEELDFHTAQTPGNNYLPFSRDIRREIARCLGVTYEAYSLDHEGSTYTSEKMGVATIWPIIERRRSRVPQPIVLGIFACWLDEEIAAGRIPFKGGYRAFSANRARICRGIWQGPPRPSADAYKDALTSKTRLEKQLTTLAAEYAAEGKDWETELEQMAREVARLKDLGLPNPYEPMSGGAGPNGAAAEGRREPAQP